MDRAGEGRIHNIIILNMCILKKRVAVGMIRRQKAKNAKKTCHISETIRRWYELRKGSRAGFKLWGIDFRECGDLESKIQKN